MSKLRAHLSYANVMSTLAVFLLLGGAGAIAAQKQTQKVGTAQLKSSAVTRAKLKNGAVDAAKLKDGAVTAAKLADGSVSGTKLADGAVGGSKIAADAVTGDKVNEATLGEVPSANSANPGAFAHVAANGVVDAANSKAVTSLNVSKAGTGVYCVTTSSFAVRGGEVTPQVGGAASAQVALGGGCAAGLQVVALNAAGSPVDSAFFVELYR